MESDRGLYLMFSSDFCMRTPECVHLCTEMHTQTTLMPPWKMATPPFNQRQSWEGRQGEPIPGPGTGLGCWSGDSKHTERRYHRTGQSASLSSGWHFGGFDLLCVVCELDFCPKLRSLFKCLLKKSSINLNWHLEQRFEVFIYLYYYHTPVCILGGTQTMA